MGIGRKVPSEGSKKAPIIPRKTKSSKTREVNGDSPESLDCTVRLVKRIFPNPQDEVVNGAWQVCIVEDVAKGDTFTVVGNMVALSDGEGVTYRIFAELELNQKREIWQYKVVHSHEICSLKTPQEQRDFLLQFLTERQVDNFFKVYPNPIEVLDSKDCVVLLANVDGIGIKTAEKILDKYEACKDYSKAYIELAKYGLTSNMIQNLSLIYRSPDTALDKIKANPYILADMVSGIGFSRADGLAISFGYDLHSVERGVAFIAHYFKESANQGNSYVYIEELEDALYDMLGNDYPEEVFDEAMSRFKKEGNLWVHEDMDGNIMVANRRYYVTEREIARHIFRLMSGENRLTLNREVALEAIRRKEEEQGWSYIEQQLEGIFKALDNNVCIVQGLAGSGKSSAVSGMLACTDVGYKFYQCALSGRASVNLTDITGAEGYTIHRLLGTDRETGGFKYTEYNPLRTDLVILDEGSMVDAELFLSLISAIPTGAKLIILGDINQLEAIGVGSIMSDMLDSGVVPYAIFDQVHRQGAESAIYLDSLEISQGRQVLDTGWTGEKIKGKKQDLKYIAFNGKQGEPKPTLELIIDEFRASFRKGEATIEDIAVIVPTKSRGTGCYQINKEIQNIVLPKLPLRGKGIEIGTTKEPLTIYKGDKVMNLSNNNETYGYEFDEDGLLQAINRPIFNGNMGEVISVDPELRQLTVDFYNIGEVVIKGKDLSNITLGYACTVHKCLLGDTMILTDRGMKRLDSLDKGTAPYDYIELDDGLMVYNGKELEKPSHFYNAGVCDTKIFTTKFGYSITTTLDHALQVADKEGQIVKKYAKDITMKDSLVLCVGANVYGNRTEVPTEWYNLDVNEKAKKFKLPTTIDTTFSRFLGRMVADGQFFAQGFRYVNHCKETVEQFCNDVEELFGMECKSKMVYRDPVHGLGFWEVKCHSKFIKGFLTNITEIKYRNKDIPSIIFETTKENQCQFLKALFEGKGSAGIRYEIEMKESAVKDLQQLLLNMGIISTVTSGLHYEDKHSLYISPFNGYLQVFEDLVMNGQLTETVNTKHIPVSITDIEEGFEQCYCITMPETHQFVQNGFDGYNCQGQGIPYVIVGIDYTHYAMLTRQLVYTALTRAKKHCTMIVEAKALQKAIATNYVSNKRTFLYHMLKGELKWQEEDDTN